MQDYLLIRGYPFYRDFKALEMADQVDQQEHIIDGTVHGNTMNEEMPNSKHSVLRRYLLLYKFRIFHTEVTGSVQIENTEKKEKKWYIFYNPDYSIKITFIV